jgi:hypothetical protein
MKPTRSIAKIPIKMMTKTGGSSMNLDA